MIQTAMHLSLLTGVSPAEMGGLEWRDIDFSYKTITIERNAVHCDKLGVILKGTKTNKARTISIPEVLVEQLLKYRKWQEEWKSSLGDYYKDESQVFSHPNGIILDLLIKENNNDGTRYQIFNVAKNFLTSNTKYGNIYRSTLFLLAEDEMNHQIFNYKYLCKYHKKEAEEFVPNMQPRLSGIDYYIEQDERKKYCSKKDEIINKYLFEEKEYDYSNIDISHLDVRLISYVFCCGLNIDDLPDKKFIQSYLKQLIEIYNKKTYHSHDIVGYYEVLEVEDYFKKCLLDSKKYSTAIEILFDKADYSKFTRETLNFYLNILASMTAFYFDSYDSKDKRKHVENVIHLMEKYINAIPVEFVKNELTKALILGFGRFGGAGDWSKCKTNYAYSDKTFLNEIFSKYGYLHFYDLLSVINHLQYKKLLPEILIAIHYSFKKYVRLKKNRSDKLEKIISFINQIMYYSFVNYESEIKGDNDLIVAFEGILLSLIELKDEKSAVLLDEFRIH